MKGETAELLDPSRFFYTDDPKVLSKQLLRRGATPIDRYGDERHSEDGLGSREGN